MADFIPNTDDALSTWLTTFKNKLAANAASLGITAADTTIYQNQCDALIAAIATVDDAKKQLKNKVVAKDAVRSDTITNIRTLVNRIKNNAAYTPAIGSDMGIITSTPVFDGANAKPTLTISQSGGQLIIKFDKQKSNGVKIYSKRGSEANFSFLALDTHSPYHDNRPNTVAGQPETRQYYAYYIDTNDEQFGLQSDVGSVTV
jgi:hypothetical protein